MGKDDNGAAPSKRDHRRETASVSEPDPDSDTDELSRKSEGKRKKYSNKKSSNRTSGSKRKRSRDTESYTSSSDSGSDSYDSDSESESDSDSSRRRRKERKRREEKKERRRREKEKEKKRKRKEDEKKRKKKKDNGKKGAVTNSWGKYGIIKETDMWNKRPEFTAWLLEVKKVNLESLPNWEEKQMFKDFMEDHNTATFPSKKYYNLDAYHQHKMEKEMKKAMKNGFAKVHESERTIFNDEEIRRLELQRERERQKEEQVEALKRSMQSGMAQAMKEQARLKEEMAYQYKLGNFEAAAAIQRRLDPDVAL